MELMEADVGRHFDGIILTPGNPSAIGASLQRLAEQGRAVVCVHRAAAGGGCGLAVNWASAVPNRRRRGTHYRRSEYSGSRG